MPQEILPPLTDTTVAAAAAPGEEAFVAAPADLPPELAFDPVVQRTTQL